MFFRHLPLWMGMILFCRSLNSRLGPLSLLLLPQWSASFSGTWFQCHSTYHHYDIIISYVLCPMSYPMRPMVDDSAIFYSAPRLPHA